MMSACNLGIVDSEYIGTDPDYDAAEALLKYVHSRRLGASLHFRVCVRSSSPPSAWKSVDGKAWNPCRVYESVITINGAYEQSGSQRIGMRTTEQAVDFVDSGDTME